MLRYVAFSWNPHSAAQLTVMQALNERLLAAAPLFSAAFKNSHLSVYCTDDSGPLKALSLHEAAGVILGTVFRRGRVDGLPPQPQLALLNPRESCDIAENFGRPLIDRYWGRYVAFISDESRGCTYIIRDPSGHLPCLKSTFHGINIFFSHMADFCALSDARPSVNWDYMAIRVIAPALQSVETGLIGVTEVQPGESHEISRGTTHRRTYWDPVSIARSPPLDDPQQAKLQLRQTAKYVIHSWASCYDSILLRVSGGLDSSIVLGCLRDASSRPRISCVTYYSCLDNADADIDERAYARIAAKHANVKLYEVPRKPTSKLQVMQNMGLFSSPLIFYDRNVEVDRLESQLAQREQATVRFGGEGGDQLFYGLALSPTVADYVHHHGIRRDLMALSAGIARRQGFSVWRLLAASIRDGLRTPSWNAFTDIVKHRDFVTPTARHALEDAGRFLHPCLHDARGIPLGKLWHIYNLSVAPRFYEANLGQPGDPPRLEPLTSQPLVELVLRIPSFVLTIGGRERQLARDAFIQDVPNELLRHRQKAAINGFAKETLRRNISFVREMLLDGDLVGQKLLDRGSLERALSFNSERIDSATGDIFDYLTMEIWLKTWSSRRQSARGPP
jgi:asparagine synthase (glutamine-hydrolysing)